MGMTNYEDLPEVQAHFAEHDRKRAAAEIEIRHTGLLRWEWRFYFGRQVVGRYLAQWVEHETGTALTRRRARRAAVRQMKRLNRQYGPWEAV